MLVAPPDHDDAMRALLAKVRLEAARARTAREVWRLARSAPPLAIVVDLGLRTQDAVTTCRDIVGLGVAPVVVVYDGERQRDDGLLLLRRGAADLVPLDEHPELAAVRIETVVNRWRDR